MQKYVDFFANHTVMVSIWLGLLVIVIYVFIKAIFSKIKVIDPQQATLLINKQDALVIDIRDKSAFNEGHIIGAKNIPFNELQKSDTHIINKKEAPIIIVCDAGARSGSVARLLYKKGFSRLFSLHGGIAQWSREKLPLVK